VFISYQWDSQKEVIEIKKFLDENNITNWFDRTNLNCKEGDLHPQLSKGIEESEIFIPFITKKYDTSANCRLEFNWARELQKTMIVVMLEKIEIKNLKNIGIFIAPKLRINYFNDHNPKEILEEIHRVIFSITSFDIHNLKYFSYLIGWQRSRRRSRIV
jgi:hypothetical protein